MTSINIKPAMLRWAAERAGHDDDLLGEYFPGISDWSRDEIALEVDKLRKFARKTRTSLGILALSEPLDDSLPFVDFRTSGGRTAGRPSVDLLDTAWVCQMRQDWYRQYVQSQGQGPLAFVGSAHIGQDPAKVARQISARLGFAVDQREDLDFDQAFRHLVDLIEQAGILVMVNGCVGNDTSRILDPEEFLGFAMPDRWAPLIFVNGSRTIYSRLFTLAHELAHIWLGSSAISNLEPQEVAPEHETEMWCNKVAGELLVPEHDLRRMCGEIDMLEDEKAVGKLRRRFRVSTMAILIRLRDIGAITPAWCDRQIGIAAGQAKASAGGDFYPIAVNRTSRRFASAILVDALDGNTLITEAMNLLNVSKMSALDKMRSALVK